LIAPVPKVHITESKAALVRGAEHIRASDARIERNETRIEQSAERVERGEARYAAQLGKAA
jgi:hypothetical protein